MLLKLGVNVWVKPLRLPRNGRAVTVDTSRDKARATALPEALPETTESQTQGTDLGMRRPRSD